MKPYLKYEDSGIEWIGEIPEHWEVLKIKRLSVVKRGASPRPIDDPKYFDENGEFAWVRIADVTASERYLERTTQKLSELGSSLSVKQYPGDFFVSIAGTVGKPIITKINCCIHDGLVWFKDLKINREFFYYIFSGGELYKGLGKWGTQLNLNTETIGDVYIPLPKENEIENIVTYLDRKTHLIDTLIENKQKLIGLLKEQRAAIINHAVTKGLNPNVKLKDLGIAWLGEIPEHWEVKKLKYFAMINPTKDNSLLSKDSGTLVTFLPMEMVNEDGTFITDMKKPIKELWNGFTYFEENDTIVAKITPCFENGKGAFLENLDSMIGFGSTEFHVLREILDVSTSKYLYYITRTNLFRKMGEAFMTGAAGQKRVPTNFIADFIIGLPSVDEQREITDYLDEQTTRMDKSIEKQERQIDHLKEYRTALISEVVTGKIDVRDSGIQEVIHS